MAGQIGTLDWPQDFPNPNVNPNSAAVKTGVRRVQMQGGNVRQRRLYQHMPMVASVAVEARTDKMMEVTKWIHTQGFTWFNLPLMTMWASKDGKMIDLLSVRVISNLQTRSLGHDYWNISFNVEVDPEVYSSSAVLTNYWIIARSPANPSSPDWYVAKDPKSPPQNTVVGGRPNNPSSTV